MMLRSVGWCLMVATLVCLTPLATGDVEARSNRRQSRPFVLSAHVVDTDSGAHPLRRVRQRSFEGYQTHTLELDVYRRGRSELERAIQIKLYLPNGDLYSAVELIPFDEVATNARGRRRTPTSTARVRVSGTAITRYGLYGEWRADVCWETGVQTTCRPGLRFEIH